jgi:hypothetical protein
VQQWPATSQSVAAKIDEKAPLASPAFTGNPTAPTPAVGDNDTSVATTAFVSANAVKKSGDTMSGNLTVNSLLMVAPGPATNGTGSIYIKADAAKDMSLIFQRSVAGDGWFGQVGAIGENLAIRVWRNNNASFTNALLIDRATGLVRVTGGVPTASDGVATKRYVDGAGFAYTVAAGAVAASGKTTVRPNAGTPGPWGGTTLDVPTATFTCAPGLWQFSMSLLLTGTDRSEWATYQSSVWVPPTESKQVVFTILQGGSGQASDPYFVTGGVNVGGVDNWISTALQLPHHTAPVSQIAERRFSGFLVKLPT